MKQLSYSNNKSDRRSSFVRVTTGGRDVFRLEQVALKCSMQSIIDMMGKDSAETLIKLLHQFSDAANEISRSNKQRYKDSLSAK